MPTKRIPVLETVASGTAAAFTHSQPMKRRSKTRYTQTGRLSCKLRLLPEDRALCLLIAKSYDISPSDVIGHAFSLMCRALRTGRDPLTGDCIDWKAATYGDDLPVELRDFLAESSAIITAQRQKKRIPLFE